MIEMKGSQNQPKSTRRSDVFNELAEFARVSREVNGDARSGLRVWPPRRCSARPRPGATQLSAGLT